MSNPIFQTLPDSPFSRSPYFLMFFYWSTPPELKLSPYVSLRTQEDFISPQLTFTSTKFIWLVNDRQRFRRPALWRLARKQMYVIRRIEPDEKCSVRSQLEVFDLRFICPSLFHSESSPTVKRDAGRCLFSRHIVPNNRYQKLSRIHARTTLSSILDLQQWDTSEKKRYQENTP